MHALVHGLDIGLRQLDETASVGRHNPDIRRLASLRKPLALVNVQGKVLVVVGIPRTPVIVAKEEVPRLGCQASPNEVLISLSIVV